MQLIRASLRLDGSDITQADLDAALAKRGGFAVRPELLVAIGDGDGAIEQWLAAKRREIVLTWLACVPLWVEGFPVHFNLNVECELWTAGRAGNPVTCAMRLLPHRLALQDGPTIAVKTLPATVDGESVATPAGVIYTTAGLTLVIAYKSHSEFARQAIGKPTPWRVASPVGGPD